MNQEKIGKFIAESRKKAKLTQTDLANILGVSTNAVSKWERGICMMDMSLLKPLSSTLNISIIDLLSGEKVEEENIANKYEESITNIVKLNRMKSKSFGVYGLLIVFLSLLFYKVFKDIPFFDIVSLLCGFNAFKFIFKYKEQKDKKDLLISIISLVVCIYLVIVYIVMTK